MDETRGPAGGGYDAWMTAALGELEQRAERCGGPLRAPRAVADLAPAERAAMALAQVIAALAAEARIGATFDAAANGRVRRGSFADDRLRFPEAAG
jgi:hypothetical protein